MNETLNNAETTPCFIHGISPCLFYVVANNSEDSWEQITNGFKTYEEAKKYRDGSFCQNRFPNAFIVCSLNEG